MIFLFDCKLDIPYPELKVEKENKDYAYLLLEDYAGINSELSSITQYSYQNFNEFFSNKNLSNSLKEIAIVEMHHLAILGKLIKLLGVNPIYKTNEYWHSKNICYTVNIKEMLLSDIDLEEKAIINYQKHIKLIDDKYIKAMLERIILDEEKHLECFHYYLNKID